MSARQKTDGAERRSGRPVDAQRQGEEREYRRLCLAKGLEIEVLDDVDAALRNQDEVHFQCYVVVVHDLEGVGIAMARAKLVQNYLETGALVRLFDLSVPGVFGYHLAWRSEQLRQRHGALRTWIYEAFA